MNLALITYIGLYAMKLKHQPYIQEKPFDKTTDD